MVGRIVKSHKNKKAYDAMMTCFDSKFPTEEKGERDQQQEASSMSVAALECPFF